MSLISSKYSLLIVGLLSIIFIVMSSNVYTYSTGAPYGYTGAPLEFTCGDGIGCHDGGTQNEGIIVSVTDQAGFPIFNYEPLTLYNIEIRVSTNFPSSCYGFETVILGDASSNSEGIITPGMGDMEVGQVGSREYIRHTATSFDGEWNFTWLSPSNVSQDISIYTAVNAANCNGTSSGDKILLDKKTLSYLPENCAVEWELLQAQPGILYFDCEYGDPDTTRLEIGITNFSGGSGNYTISCPGGELSTSTASPGDTVYLWFNQYELANSNVTILVNDESSFCAPYDSVNIALLGFPIEAICNNYEDPCQTEVAFGDMDPALDLDDFYCEGGNLVLSGTLDGPHVGYYLDLYEGYPGWMSAPANFELVITQDILENSNGLVLDISLGESGSLCQAYSLSSVLESISIDEFCSTCNVSFDSDINDINDITCVEDGSEYNLVFSIENFTGNSSQYTLNLSAGSLSTNSLGTQPGTFETEVTLSQADVDAGQVILTVTSQENDVCEEISLLTALQTAYPDGIDIEQICNPSSSIAELQNEELRIYPNPALAGSVIHLGDAKVDFIELIDLNGRVVDSGVSSDSRFLLNDNLQAGVYTVRIKSEDSFRSARIVVIE